MARPRRLTRLDLKAVAWLWRSLRPYVLVRFFSKNGSSKSRAFRRLRIVRNHFRENIGGRGRLPPDYVSPELLARFPWRKSLLTPSAAMAHSFQNQSTQADFGACRKLPQGDLFFIANLDLR